MPHDYFDLCHTVSDDEVDAQAHVHNLQYLQWTLWAARDHNAVGGWDAAAALAKGLGWVVRDHQITYRAAAFGGDEIVVRTWISDIRRYACTRSYQICRPADKQLLCRASTRWVFVDLTQHRALEVPAEAAAAVRVRATPPPLPWE
ncbi:acyl-CoA thioesterase [Allorhodopirellula heiligendammensis]|uniref:Acyl-ACP thioesterase n=1 Tax=Allorhodopirellula heiligendammensis TaxID=2714739 RepID=A0A5C6BW32_9BACT|nr:acyl-CoA thioesterase [Allorhodopirellula heiligendammensis]TWU16102.1 Acyl-ACP thioesterase [Allorhodopirellula heiligendammensis]